MKKFIKMVEEKKIKGKLEITPNQRNAADFTFHTTEKKKKIFKSYFLSNNETQKNEKICIFLVIQGKSFIRILIVSYFMLEL